MFELLPASSVRLFSVGRLDYNTEGALLLTNDGDLAHGLMHPSRGVPKVYDAKLRGLITADQLRRLRAGVPLPPPRPLDREGRPLPVQHKPGLVEHSSPAQVDVVSSTGKHTWLRFVLHEGKNRQIHRMCEAIGSSLLKLIRVSYAGLELGDLATSEHRPLRPREIHALRQSVGLPPLVGEETEARGAQRPERGERSGRPGRIERTERGERGERGERTGRPERSGRPERTERPEQRERSERSGWSDRPGRAPGRDAPGPRSDVRNAPPRRGPAPDTQRSGASRRGGAEPRAEAPRPKDAAWGDERPARRPPRREDSAEVDPQVQFRFVGLSDRQALPTRWLDPETRATIDGGAPSVILGPEAILPPQRIVLRLGERQLEIATDGLAPFAVPGPPPGTP